MPTPLPIDPLLPAIRERLGAARSLVIEAPPGAGKTTRVPPALLECCGGEIVVLEPRRLAARLAARRVAQELGERVGETAGYQVRFEDVSGPRTRIRFMTEGVLTRRLLTDPSLSGVSIVILDEFHERHLEGDLALALLRRLQRTARPDLRLAVMSATLEAAPVAAWLSAGEPLRSEGRQHPLAVSYTPESPLSLHEQVAAALHGLIRDGVDGHILVFLPGAAEIRAAARACEAYARTAGLLILPLHGDLPPEEQDRAVQPSDQAKLVLSTNVAESSVTIEGVTAVIDSGLARVATQSPWSGLPRLTVSRVSRASADQRAGRAGRTAPGRVIRLYTEHDYVRRPAHDVPEILRAELSPVVLELAALGADGIEWMDAPPAAALDAARDLLLRLGALDAHGQLTHDGRRMAALPLHPRLARLVLSGAGDDGIQAAAVLSSGERLSDSAADGPSDLLALAERDWEPRTRQAYQQIRRTAPYSRKHSGAEEPFLKAVLAAFPDRVARRRRGDQLLLSNGGSAVLDTRSVLRDREFMVAVDVEERSDRTVPLVRLASAIDPGWLLDLFPDRVRETVSLEWNRESERVEETRVLLYDQLAIDETYGAPTDSEAAAQMLAERAVAAGLSRFNVGELQRLRDRVAFAASHSGIEPLTETEIQDTIREMCRGLRGFNELERRLRNSALIEALEARRPARLLNEVAPARIRLPGGKYVNVNYADGQPPWVSAKLQEFFGMTSSPIAGGQPIVLHLLAPNNRPVQTTADLAGFWKRLYPELRRELGRRYPRHRWPEDPLSAEPGERIRRPRQ